MSFDNSLVTRFSSFVLPWSTDLDAGPRKSNDLSLYTSATSLLQKHTASDMLDLPLEVYNDYASSWVQRARYFKLAIGVIGLIAAAVLLYLGLQTSSSALFYGGVGCAAFSAAWFLCLVVRNQTTGQGLPTCLPCIGGWRIRNR